MMPAAFCAAAPALGARPARSARCSARDNSSFSPCSTFTPSLPGVRARIVQSQPAAQRNSPSMAATGRTAVVSGGTGFIGSRLAAALRADGWSVTILTRGDAPVPAGCNAVRWNPGRTGPSPATQEALRGADLVVNLAGHPVVSRWSESGRALITNSRVGSTSAIANAVAALPAGERPGVVVSASAVGFYGVDSETPVDEGTPAAVGFLPDVCQKWEAAAEPMGGLTRLVTLRFGVAVGPGGGALSRMLPAFQFGVGGPVGTGKQCVSWVHVDDIVSMVMRAATDVGVRGVYNATAPKPVSMQEFSGALAKALKRPNLFPVPELVLQLAYGEAAEVVLKGQRVLPKRWLAEGFEFKYPDVDSAMQAVADEIG